MRECTPALFNQVVDSEQTARVCAEIEDALENVRRGEMSREDFETYKAEQKKRLAIFTPHAMFPKGRRVNEDAVPSGLSMYDVDHISLTPESLTPSPSPRGEGSDYSHGQKSLYQRLVEHTLAKEPFTDEGMKEELKRLGICLVHVTPSTEGFRLFFAVPEGMSLEEAQKWMSEQLGDEHYDGCVKDLARCSFVVPRDYILYLDEEELFKSLTPSPSPEGEGSGYTSGQNTAQDNNCTQGQNPAQEDAGKDYLLPSPKSVTPAPSPKGEGSGYSRGMNQVQSDYSCGMNQAQGNYTRGMNQVQENSQENYLLPSPTGEGSGVRLFRGIPYSDIIREWWLRTGGEPQAGERNVKLHKLAANLRAICDNKKEVLMAVMPRFGLSETELKSIVDSACKEEPKGVSKMLQQIVSALEASPDPSEGGENDADGDSAFEHPLLRSGLGRLLPMGLKESLAGVPVSMHMPVLCSVLPIAAAYADQVEVEYCDGNRQRLGLMSIIRGEQASGKSVCKNAVDVWKRQFEEEDALARKREEEWKERKKARKANEKAPEDPKVLIRMVPVTVSCSTLLKRLKNSCGHTLLPEACSPRIIDISPSRWRLPSQYSTSTWSA